ncbi:MAG: VOC family protein [Gammaproteobacteria bacterium]
MSTMQLEHINLTVSDPQRTARLLEKLFDWHVRWEGAAMDEGYTVHIGSDERYLALYSPQDSPQSSETSHTALGLNHIGVVVNDLDDIERRVKAAGFKTFNHAEYEPGRRFYFQDSDRLEFEVISYSTP